jgi:hypothetical protein
MLPYIFYMYDMVFSVVASAAKLLTLCACTSSSGMLLCRTGLEALADVTVILAAV